MGPLWYSADMTSPRDAVPVRFMTTSEVAQLLRVSTATVYKLIRQRQIPALKIGSDYRFDKDSIDKLMARGLPPAHLAGAR